MNPDPQTDTETTAAPLWSARLVLPETLGEVLGGDVAAALADSMADLALSASHAREKIDDKEHWTIQWITEGEPSRAEMIARIALTVEVDGLPVNISAADLEIAPVPDINWLEYTYRAFPPFSVGQFYIFGSHHEDSPKPEGLIPLQIDAATAFGSGEHGTTKGCLLALQDLHAAGFSPRTALDVGTGSGILGIAAAKLMNIPVLATDNDPESVRMAALHRDLNAVPEKGQGQGRGQGEMVCDLAEGYDSSVIAQGAPYDLIFANILAGPLISMAGDLARNLSPEGRAILSGLLIEQADDVLAAHTTHGLTLASRRDIDEWSTLVLRKA